MKMFLKRIIASFLLICILSHSFFAFGANASGDMNSDGKISLADARIVLKIVSGIKAPTSTQIATGDMNGDGSLTLSDVKAILLDSVDIAKIQPLQYFSQKTPTKNQGSNTTAKFIKVTEYCAETFPESPVNDKSSPLYTTLPKGTFDYVKSGPVTDSESGKKFYVLKSGRRVYANEVKVFTGYKMPYNQISLPPISKTTKTATEVYLKLDWRVPYNTKIKPQEYETGYNNRPYNISEGKFTGSYMDITFSYTQTASGTLTFPESKVVKSCKWILNDENKTATLRIYFRTAGEFSGYTAYYNSDNYLVISFKEPVSSLKGRVIEIDPGHGGNQPGAGSGTGVYEKDITYKIATQLKAYLEKSGATVILSRDNSSSVPEIEERRLNTIKKNPDMLVSIHLDSSSDSSAKGSSVYYYTSYSGELAGAIATNLPKPLKSNLNYTMKNRGAHFYPFRVTRVENCPAVLVECGFISNSSDFKIQNSASGQKNIACGIYKGILEYYGL